MANRQRIMSFVFDEPRLTIRETACDVLRESNGKSAVFCSWPESHRNANIFGRKSPRLCVDLCVDHYSFRRSAPGTSLALENCLKRCVIPQAGRVTRAQ